MIYIQKFYILIFLFLCFNTLSIADEFDDNKIIWSKLMANQDLQVNGKIVIKEGQYLDVRKINQTIHNGPIQYEVELWEKGLRDTYLVDEDFTIKRKAGFIEAKIINSNKPKWASIRSCASLDETACPIQDYAANNVKVKVLGKNNNNWYYIRYQKNDGTISNGWIDGRHLQYLTQRIEYEDSLKEVLEGLGNKDELLKPLSGKDNCETSKGQTNEATSQIGHDYDKEDAYYNNPVKLADYKPSQYILDVIKRFETYGGALEPNFYDCSSGCCTIGYGHKVSDCNVENSISVQDKFLKSLGIFDRRYITGEEAEKVLRSDVQKEAIQGLKTYLDDEVVLKQHEWDALVSFVFNLGGGGALNIGRKDPTVKDLITRYSRTTNPKAKESLKSEIVRVLKTFNKANGEVSQGQVVRRAQEAQIFLGERVPIERIRN